MYQVRTIFWRKIWRGVVLSLLNRLKPSNLYERETKYSAFVFLPDKQTSGCLHTTFYANQWQYQKYPVSYSLHSLTSQNVGKNATSSSPYIKTFSNCYFVDISVSVTENNTTSNSTSHGQEVRNLAKVPCWQCSCPNQSTHLLGTFGHGNISIPPLRAQNFSTIRLLTLRVKFDGI